MADIRYKTKIRWVNRRELKKHLKALIKKYGKGNMPLEETFEFDF